MSNHFIVCDSCGGAADRDASIRVCEDVASLVICSTCRDESPDAQKRLQEFSCPNTLNLARIHRLRMKLQSEVAELLAEFELLTGRRIQTIAITHLVRDASRHYETTEFYSWKSSYSDIIGIGETVIELMNVPPPPKEEREGDSFTGIPPVG